MDQSITSQRRNNWIFPGGTDGHTGEVQLRDGESLYGGGDWTDCPAGEGLVDDDNGSCEAGDDDTQPEESKETSATSDVDQAVYGGALQELLHTVHGKAGQSTEYLLRPLCWLVVLVTT